MSQKQNENLSIAPAEAVVVQSMAEQVLAPGKPGMLFVDGGCSNWPYAYGGGPRSQDATTRDFNGARYIALDGGKSSSAASDYRKSAMKGWDDKGRYMAEAVQKVQTAREHGIDADYIRADLESLPFADKSVDELFLSDVILAPSMDARSMQAMVQEAGRVVRTGGMFVLKETEVPPARMQPEDYLEQQAERDFRRGKLGINQLRSERALQALLRANGFEFEVYDGAQHTELIGKLNDIYCTSASVMRNEGAYILARKLPEVIKTPKDRRGLKRFLGRKSLA